MSPDTYNWIPYSRTSSNWIVANANAAPKISASFDDTYSLTRLIATGTLGPFFRVETVDPIEPGVYTASVWLKTDPADPPVGLYLGLLSAGFAQFYATEITNDGTLARYSCSGYLDGATNPVSVGVFWDGPAGTVYVDAVQLELNDYASPFIPNETGNKLMRQSYFDPDRIHGIAPYVYERPVTWSEVLYGNEYQNPYTHSTGYPTTARFANMNQGKLNLSNVPTASHIAIRGAKRARTYTYADATVELDMPEPYYWTWVSGATARMKQDIYDIGTNKEASAEWAAFTMRVEEMLLMVGGSPGWGTLDVVNPVMMR